MGGAVVTLPFVIGLGSHHGDDQAGWLIIDSLRERGYPSDRLIRARHPAELLDTIDARQSLVMCDACVGSGSIGAVRHWRWPVDRVAYQRPNSTHNLSLGDVLDLGRRIECLPNAIDIWTVEGANWSPGESASTEIVLAARGVADAIWRSCADA
jgi:hydrogenase maturation protease